MAPTEDAPQIGPSRLADPVILIARILMMALFVIFGWQKLTGYPGTVAYLAQTGAPAPQLSAAIAIVMEFVVGAALLIGAFTRPLAILLLVYTFAAALIGHHYWTLTGLGRVENMINFYKNISIMGGLLLLWVTGGGRYSIDRLLSRR